MIVNGRMKTIDEVLADPGLAPLLSRDGVMRESRYPVERGHAQARPAVPCPPPARRSTSCGSIPESGSSINRPAVVSSKPVLLVFYALPNGNTIEQTIGKAVQPGDDWHFDIQHIGAQTRFLRETIKDRTVVVAYLENDLKSWPAWRRKYGDANDPPRSSRPSRSDSRRLGPRIVLAGHSGGGSLIFGYINSVSTIPDQVERIAFLDANYAYETDRHRDKLAAWLGASDRHYLFVLAYNDAVALLNGKTFVSATGGTWGRSHLMDARSRRAIHLRQGSHRRHATLHGAGRTDQVLPEGEPGRKVLHTVQVERNGFIESMLSGTGLGGRWLHVLR